MADDERHRHTAQRGDTSSRGSAIASSIADDGAPNVARIYDYFLGGSHHFAVDRERAEVMRAARPGIVATVRANRGFLRHAVERCLAEGVRQFLDLGSGIPTIGSVHEVARRRDPAARVAYVDREAVVVAHSTAILAEVEGVTITAADFRDPGVVLGAPGVAGLLDLDEPVALLALTALHFVWDAQDPTAMLRGYRRALAPGSVLALSHASDDYPDHPEFVRAHREVREMYDSTSDPIQLRSRAAIRGLVVDAGFEPDADGLVEMGRWAVPPQEEPLGGYAVMSEPLS